MKKRTLGLLFLFLISLALALPACAGKEQKTVYSYTRGMGASIVQVLFDLPKGYTGADPLKKYTYEERVKREKETFNPTGYYEIYKDDTRVLNYYLYEDYQNMPPLPTSVFESHEESLKAKGETYEKGSTETFEYLYYVKTFPYMEQKRYTYLGRFKEPNDVIFEIYSTVSKEEADKLFKCMSFHFTEYSMELKNITVSLSSEDHHQRAEADLYPEQSQQAAHIVVDVTQEEATFSDFPEEPRDECWKDSFQYQQKALRVLLNYVSEGLEDKELSVTWK